MTNDELQERIENSPALRKLQEQLQAEIGFRAATAIELNPLLVLAIISLIIQIISFCRSERSAAAIRDDMRELRSLPPFQSLRLRRKLNALWRDVSKDETVQSENPLLEAVYQLSDSVDDTALDELIWLADMYKPPES